MSHATDDFPRLLDHLGDLIGRAKHIVVTPENAWKNHGQLMLIKAYGHLDSIATLAGIPRHGGETSPVRFIDHSSIAVLGRAAYETYTLFYFIFCEPDTAKREFRHQVWRLSGLIGRSKLNRPANLPRARLDQIEQESAEIERLRKVVETNPLFEELDKDTKRSVKKGNDVRLGAALIDLAEAAGLPRKYVADMYNHFNSYAHSGAISAFQMQEAILDSTAPILARTTIGFCCILLSQMIIADTKLFPEIDEYAKHNDELIEIVALWDRLKQQFASMYNQEQDRR